MKALRSKYDEEKAEEKVSAIQISKRAQAKSVAEKINKTASVMVPRSNFSTGWKELEPVEDIGYPSPSRNPSYTN